MILVILYVTEVLLHLHLKLRLHHIKMNCKFMLAI